jgi:hypothetical protein
MLGLDFVLASCARNASETGACSWGTVTQTEQTASSFFYGNGGTKFRKSEILIKLRGDFPQKLLRRNQNEFCRHPSTQLR